uniref:Uncharacterized protein n=1 Tax=Ursus americanus TaxID=9643 RepID=A0A452QEK4_URSAM
MVGRENELSIHFVPGSCRLVEVRESAWGSRRNRECRGERAWGFDLPCAFCRNPSPRKCFFRNSRFGDDNLLNSYLSARHYVMHFTCIINRHNCEILFLLHFADEKIEVYMMSSSSKLIQ